MEAVDSDMMRENSHSTMTINKPDRQSRVTFGGPKEGPPELEKQMANARLAALVFVRLGLRVRVIQLGSTQYEIANNTQRDLPRWYSSSDLRQEPSPLLSSGGTVPALGVFNGREYVDSFSGKLSSKTTGRARTTRMLTPIFR